jgi:hypothetical protein
MKLKMLKTVFDGRTYHKAGQIVDVNKDVERHYLNKGFAQSLKQEVVEEVETIDSIEDEAELETKEEKKVYKKRK